MAPNRQFWRWKKLNYILLHVIKKISKEKSFIELIFLKNSFLFFYKKWRPTKKTFLLLYFLKLELLSLESLMFSLLKVLFGPSTKNGALKKLLLWKYKFNYLHYIISNAIQKNDAIQKSFSAFLYWKCNY